MHSKKIFTDTDFDPITKMLYVTQIKHLLGHKNESKLTFKKTGLVLILCGNRKDEIVKKK